MALDDRQHVVEVVRDTGSQLSHRLHFLRLPQLLLQVQPLGDVHCIGVDDLAYQDRKKRPRQRPSIQRQESSLWRKRYSIRAVWPGLWTSSLKTRTVRSWSSGWTRSKKLRP